MASYVLYKIDNETWKAFKAKAAKNGTSIRTLLLGWIQGYLEQGDK